MDPRPAVARAETPGGRLHGRVALITGGDSGIGRAVAVAFAREGADIAALYLDEHDDANTTREMVADEGGRCLLIPGDIGDEDHCAGAVATVVEELGRLDVVVNNAAEQHATDDFIEISRAQLESTFRTNVFGMFSITQAALPHLGEGAAIVNTASVTAYKGNPKLIDYSATKGAIVAFTRALAIALADRGIRVNAVAPGPVWTPLIPATFDAEAVAHFGEDVPLGRPGEPAEIAPSFVFLASEDASYITGQVIHPNGGTIVNG
jgi:NAD(P)-dependent dehydrogenase (short-subunit alcohol dehydrogenase family)